MPRGVTSKGAGIVFLVLIGALVALTIVLNVKGAKQEEPRSEQALTAAVLSAKIALFGRGMTAQVPGADLSTTYEDSALSAFEEAAKSEVPSDRAKALRRLAILRSLFGRADIAAPLKELEGLSAEDRKPAPEDEVAILRGILAEPVTSETLPLLEIRLHDVSLGWFDALLKERLYRRAGDTKRADDALSEAEASALAAVIGMFAFGAAILGGAIAWLIVLATPLRKKLFGSLRESLSRPSAQPLTVSARLGVFAAYLALSLVVWTFARRVPVFDVQSPTGRGAMLVLSMSLIALGTWGISWLLRPASRPTLSELGWQSQGLLRNVGRGVAAYLLLLPLILVVILPLSALFEKLGIPSQSHPIVDELQAGAKEPLALVLLFVVASVGAPLIEETLFRGVLHPALKHRLGGLGSAALTSLIFASLHPQIGLGLVGVGIIGFVLTLVYEHTGSLVSSAVAHALNNGVLLAFAFLLFGT